MSHRSGFASFFYWLNSTYISYYDVLKIKIYDVLMLSICIMGYWCIFFPICCFIYKLVVIWLEIPEFRKLFTLFAVLHFSFLNMLFKNLVITIALFLALGSFVEQASWRGFSNSRRKVKQKKSYLIIHATLSARLQYNFYKEMLFCNLNMYDCSYMDC